AIAHAGDGADAERRGMVGSGGRRRPDHDLPSPREVRHGPSELSGRGPVVSRRMGVRRRAKARCHRLRQRDGEVLSRCIEVPFFDFYRKDKGRRQRPEALIFESGSNVWKSFDAWPPKTGVVPRPLYFGEHGSLSFTRPSTPSAFDAYVSDPAYP